MSNPFFWNNLVKVRASQIWHGPLNSPGTASALLMKLQGGATDSGPRGLHDTKFAN